MPRLPSTLRSTAVPRSCLYLRSRWHAGSDVMPATITNQKPPPPPSGIGHRCLRTDTAIIVNDTPSWVLNCCDHDTDPLLDPPKGRPQNGVHVWIRNRPPKRCPPTVGGHFLGGGKWVQKWTLNWGRFSKPSGRIFSKPESACDNKTTFTRFTGKPVYVDASLCL